MDLNVISWLQFPEWFTISVFEQVSFYEVYHIASVMCGNIASSSQEWTDFWSNDDFRAKGGTFGFKGAGMPNALLGQCTLRWFWLQQRMELQLMLNTGLCTFVFASVGCSVVLVLSFVYSGSVLALDEGTFV